MYWCFPKAWRSISCSIFNMVQKERISKRSFWHIFSVYKKRRHLTLHKRKIDFAHFAYARSLNQICFAKIWLIDLLQFFAIRFLLYNLVDGKISLLVVLSTSFAIFYILFALFSFYDNDDKKLILAYISQFLLSKSRRLIWKSA